MKNGTQSHDTPFEIGPLAALNTPTNGLLRDAITDALRGQRGRKHLEIWRIVEARYPGLTYSYFDQMMGQLEFEGVIGLTGYRGPNTYKLL